MNHFTGLGRLTRSPELRYTNSGTAVCSFTLAIDRQRKDAKGEKQTDFVPIVVWGKLGELCGQYLDKGRQAAVMGELQFRSYENKQGQKVQVAEVMANFVQFLDKAEGKPQTKTMQQPARPYGNDPFGDSEPIDIDDDSLPF